MQQYLAETITDADYTEDLLLLTNISTQTEFLQLSLEQVPRGIGLYLESDKTEFMCFKENGTISTLNGKPLKLVHLFTYLRGNISSTENDVNICMSKAWNTIDKLSIIW